MVTSRLAASVINQCDQLVQVEGTNMLWKGEIVAVDAPCSGVRMLWSGLFFCFTLATFYNLVNFKTWLLYGSTNLLVFIGNTIRTILLFYTESGIVKAPEWVHPAIGIVCFCIVALGILAISQKLKGGEKLCAV